MPCTKEFYKLSLQSAALAIGQRAKGRTFRPCVETLPTSMIAGAMNEYFPGKRIVGIGFFRKATYQKAYFTHAPLNRRTGTSVLPLTLEYLEPAPDKGYVEADVYLPRTDGADLVAGSLPLELSIGALRYKGFGRIRLDIVGVVTASEKASREHGWFPYRTGYFEGEIRETELEDFGIEVIAARYGYLFEPDRDNSRTGRYRRAIFPGSLIKAPAFLVSQEYKYDA